MAIGKNKRLSKGKKGKVKKAVDALARKQWYRLNAPNPFMSKSFGWTCINKSSGLKKAHQQIKGRVVESYQADLQQKSASQGRKVKLIIDQAEGKRVRTSFYGFDMTRDQNATLINKWHTLIQAFTQAKTVDGYILRIFIMAMTQSPPHKKVPKSYAKTSQIKQIRKRMIEKVNRSISSKDITTAVDIIATEALVDSLKKQTCKIFPLEFIKIKKVKVIQRPKIDTSKLNEMYRQRKTRAQPKLD